MDGWVGGWWPTFDAESRNVKIQILISGVGGWGVGGQLLMLSPEMLKSKFSFLGWVGGWMGGWVGGLVANF